MARAECSLSKRSITILLEASYTIEARSGVFKDVRMGKPWVIGGGTTGSDPRQGE